MSDEIGDKPDDFQSRGGIARRDSLSRDERSKIASKAAQARWAIPKPTHQGTLHIGDLIIDCAVMPDGTRVLSERSVGRSLGRSRGGVYTPKGEEGAASAGDKLPFFASSATLKPFIDNELMLALTSPVRYQQLKGGGVGHGLVASALPKVCNVWLRAREAGVLSRPQLVVAQRAEMLMRGLAEVGIVALVDEATGYQEVRDRQALQAILDKFFRKELAAWAKRFPDDFYRQIFRLRGWKWNTIKRPGVVAAYTRDLVYARLAPGVLEELERKNPVTDKGRRLSKHHQWLSDDIGHPALAQHLHAVIGLMRASESWDGLKTLVNRAFPKRGENLELELRRID
ncbi:MULTISPECIES: P63C domain-containing protein [unclassified Lysobacter]|uniref:P63C domain-containing protein n=1 Tax=unclassified Lysobacter TaxID=2635362 RepID=UPI001BE83B4D|nr:MULTISPECIES: P63C domain-containing protein [unclassified Lysobacter]MBT2746832.1 P63C domain-containing protein [Lysobacter sp. ISL-42]MBT2750683.1 P63C domain-containing protein [Lysobacter sp. ISL-50]MBT2779512.1 P63C domain-containing protein [Lysobacter sp. ISL-54]MBT2784656.1 P63C domain-containing protein [Lysobacter sp. ISL-52]